MINDLALNMYVSRMYRVHVQCGVCVCVCEEKSYPETLNYFYVVVVIINP